MMEWLVKDSAASHRTGKLLDAASEGKLTLLMSAINTGEIYYYLRKHFDITHAEHWRETVSALPVRILVPTEQDIWDAAGIKGDCALSYADAFAAALAIKHKCPLVTGDPEFRTVPNLRLEWLGNRPN